MTLDLGDEAVAGETETYDFPTNSDVSAGDALVWDAGNDRLNRTSAAGENVFGIAAEDNPTNTNGALTSVHVGGPVVASAGGSVVQGDVVVSGSTAGQLDQNADGTGKSTDIDGTTDQGVFAPANPIALTDSGGSWPENTGNSLGSNEAVVRLP